ncbi:carboxypeptidase-like regulatory domain-containing protein [Olivibacter sp. SA151]|uniref:TonB-dependent receptor n=1 Tax=Olivibacter jilunii TaxID=985016 RepID=UPI003F1869DE
MKVKTLIFLTLLFSGSITFAQQKGIVSGVVVDASLNNETMPAVSVAVQGTKLGANTDIDGKFKLELNPGTHILVFSYVGYQTLRDTVTVKAGNNVNLNVAMASDAQMLDDVVIVGEVRKDTESALLRKQMNSAVITQSIGSQEMSRKGISNAAVAITKVTGIAKQEGTSGVFVRGLGDRYNNTLLNGLPLPSNEPTSKNISLDLFGTDVIQSIGISKIYTADDYGDVGGATVNILSKEHIGPTELSVGIGGGINTGAFQSDFKRADGLNRFGFYNIKTPNTIQEYTFDNRWTPKTINKPFGYDFSLSGGTSFAVGKEGRINLFATASQSSDFSFREGSEKIVGETRANVIADYFDIKKYGYHTNTTGMLNLAYRLNPKHLIKWNSIFINGSSSSVNEYLFLDGQGATSNTFTRQTLTQQNKLFLNQLLGEHQFNERLNLDWGASYGKVDADMPDRITNEITENNAGDGFIYSGAASSANNRFYQYINEKEWAGRAALSYKVLNDGQGDYNGKLTLGYTGRAKKRDFEATQFNMRVNSSNIAADPSNIDAFINPNNFSRDAVNGTFTITTARGISLAPWVYDVDLQLHGGYLNFEHNPNNRLTYTLGLRADKILQKMTWDVNIPTPSVDFDDAKIDKLFILPEATLKYALTDNQNLRVAASKSYTLPQFLEKAPFGYEDVTMFTRGNPNLKPADNYNLDLKWEKFPTINEVLAVGVFGKYISNPISQLRINGADPNTISFVNAGDYAYVAGIELEARKSITENLSGGINLTYMYSYQKLDAEKVLEETNNNISVNFNTDHDRLQGASPFLANADFTYKGEWSGFKPTISLVGNYFYDRIFSLGNRAKGNIVEKGYPIINFVAGAEIGSRWEATLKVNNLTNSRIKMEQENSDGPINVYSYKRGLDLGIGVKYKLIKK